MKITYSLNSLRLDLIYHEKRVRELEKIRKRYRQGPERIAKLSIKNYKHHKILVKDLKAAIQILEQSNEEQDNKEVHKGNPQGSI